MLRRAAIGLIMKGAGLVGGTAGARTAAVRAFSLAAPVFAPAVPSPARGMWGGLLLLRSRGMCSAAPTDENPPADKPAPRSPMLNMLQKWRRPNFEHGGDIMSQRVEERKLPAAHRIDDWWTDNHGVDIRSTRKPWEDARYPELAEAEYKWRKSKVLLSSPSLLFPASPLPSPSSVSRRRCAGHRDLPCRQDRSRRGDAEAE